jgi:hypothetical protein
VAKGDVRVIPRCPRSIEIFCALSLSLAVCGCGTLKLHSDVRQKQGEDLAKAWKEVNLKSLFDAERVNQAKLLETEIAGWNRHFDERYQSELRRLARMPVGSYHERYLQLLDTLAGPLMRKDNPSEVDDVVFAEISKHVGAALRAVREEGTAIKELAISNSFLKSLRVPAFSCEQLLTKTEIVESWKAENAQLASNVSVSTALSESKNQCTKLVGSQKAYIDALNQLPEETDQKGLLKRGLLKNRMAAWKSDQEALKKRLLAVDDATIELNKRQKEYDASIVTGKPLTEDAKAKAKKLADALDALTTAQDVFGIEIASEARVKRIDDLLKSLEEGKELSTDTASKLEVAISLFPRVADALRAVRDQGKGTASMPLLIQRDVEQAKLSSARIEAARLKQRVELRAIALLAAVRQTDSVLTALKRVESVSPSGKGLMAAAAAAAKLEASATEKVLNDKTATPEAKNAARSKRDKQDAAMIDSMWGQLSPDDRRFVLESTVNYLDAHTRQELSIQTIETTRLATSMDRNVDLAEVNAALWMALINSTVTQAAEYSALGLKASDFERIINFLMLGYIGYGVNK